MSLKLASAARTDPGKKRPNNEDSYIADDALGLYVVCDGVGGNQSGEVASRRAVEALRDAIAAERARLDALANDTSDHAPAQVAVIIEHAVQRACAEVHKARTSDRSLAGMSTTLDCVVRVGRRVAIGHVGDSRVYLVRGGRTYRLTEDHTIVAEQVKAGLMTEAQAAESTMKGVLTRSLGSHASVQVDRLVLDVMPGDLLILCSDGLHGTITDEQLAQYAVSHAPFDLPGTFVRHANDAGGKDNVTAVVVTCLSQDIDTQSIMARARIDAIQATPLLHNLSYKEQVAVLAIATSQFAAPGQTIMREGEPGGDMFVVVRGKLAVSKAGAQIAELGPGGIVGEQALVDYAPRSATVTATVGSDLLAFSRDAMTGLMRSDPALGMKILWNLVQQVSGKLRASSEELAKPG